MYHAEAWKILGPKRQH